MLNREKVIEYFRQHFDDTNSEKDRLIKDFMILMEFGNFDEEDEDSGPDF
ncbi:hypothetical protein [Paenibacillus sp. FSL H7-0326]|nr:hypothetical protein [Paenibacillus sp. FSL H7-0326]